MTGADSSWFVQRPRSVDDWRTRAGLVRERLVVPDWTAALAPAIAASGQAAARLDRAAASGFVVTTGQQPGLFGGPLYAWWKALSALALADRLEAATGLPVAPVFWAATDDGDFDEASGTVVATVDGAERIEIPAATVPRVSLARIPIGDVSSQIARLAAAAGSASNARIIEIVRHAYRPGQTIGGAYVELLRSVLEPLGISVLDAAHPAVSVAAHPLLKLSLKRARDIEGALAERAQALKAAGHSPQVKLVKGRTLLFTDGSGKRERVRIADAESASAAPPGALGPNVLLRPVVESYILPTVAYLGGPAEIAYFAQVTAVAQALDVPAPLVLPRWSGVVIEPRIDRILQRHQLAAGDFRDSHAVETQLARDSLPTELLQRLAELRDATQQSASRLESAEGAGLVGPGVIQGLTKNFDHRVDRLERRFAASVKRKGTESLRDAAIARGSLYPFGSPQERALNFVPLYARYGDELISAVLSEASRHAAKLA